MTIKRIEDLEAWKESITLCKLVYQISEGLPSTEKYNIIKHMRECARNVPANIAEGFGRYHYQESIQFYRIARGSLNELKSDIYLCNELSYISEGSFKTVVKLIENIIMKINGLIITSKNFKSTSY